MKLGWRSWARARAGGLSLAWWRRCRIDRFCRCLTFRFSAIFVGALRSPRGALSGNSGFSQGFSALVEQAIRTLRIATA